MQSNNEKQLGNALSCKSALVDKTDESSEETTLPSSYTADMAQTTIQQSEKKEDFANKNDDKEQNTLNNEPEITKVSEKMFDHKNVEVLNEECLFKNKMETSTQVMKIADAEKYLPSNSHSTPVQRNVSIIEIERIYQKYFSKFLQDSIEIVANIMYIIVFSLRHHEMRMYESDKMKTEEEKWKESIDAEKIHKIHRIILKSKLKMYFEVIVSSFDESDLELGFQMCFVCVTGPSQKRCL